MPRIRGAVALACLLGGYLRLWPVLSASFPLNAGGRMRAAMACRWPW
jgi:hypothetical protein